MPRTSPLVSVIVPIFQAERFLEDAIDSVRRQTLEDWELLLVDDGSTDGGREIAHAAVRRDPARTMLLEHPGRANCGLPASRNRALAVARGTFVAPLDADDTWQPQKLERQVQLLNEWTEAALVFGSPKYWRGWTGLESDTRHDIVPGPGVEADTLHHPPTLLARLYPLGSLPAPCPSDLLVHRSWLTRLGGFEPSFSGPLSMYEDQALLAKLYLAAPAWVSSESWTWYRVHSDQMGTRFIRHYDEARHFFLEWLKGYLDARQVQDQEIRRLLWHASLPYRDPRLA